MKKRNAIFGLILCAGLLFSVGSFSNRTSANAGLAVAKIITDNEYAGAFATGVGGVGGAWAAAWAGAKIGGTFGTFLGGPIGTAIGGGLGAL